MRERHYESRAQINFACPHQIELPASQCEGEMGSLQRLYCANLNMGSGHMSVIVNEVTRVIYCFEDRQDADRFRNEFGGRRLQRMEKYGQLRLPGVA
jgi:hypothetical protein